MTNERVPEFTHVCNGGFVPPIFLVLTAAIAQANNEGDHRTADLLLAGKDAVVKRHYALLAEGR